MHGGELQTMDNVTIVCGGLVAKFAANDGSILWDRDLSELMGARRPGSSKEDLVTALTAIDFTGSAEVQSQALDDLVGSGVLRAWKAAIGAFASSSATRVHSVSMGVLESKSGGKLLTPEALGIAGLGAVGSSALLPSNVGVTLCYAFALLPIV